LLKEIGYTDESFEWTHGNNLSNSQTDGYNCGVFTIFNIICSITNGRTRMPKAENGMISYRKLILSGLLKE
jgi:Ulp1 family protease